MVGFTVETPLVGTRFYDENESRLTTRDWSLFDLEHAVLPTAMPLDSFYREMTRLHLVNGLRSTPEMLRAFPLRDMVQNWRGGWGALRDVLRSARDHEMPAGRNGARGDGLTVPARA